MELDTWNVKISYGDIEKGVGILPHQLDIHNAIARAVRFVLLNGGIKCGKSYTGAREFAYACFKHTADGKSKGLGWILAPTYKMAREAQDAFEKVLDAACPGKQLYTYNKAEKQYTLITGFKIDVRTADNPEHLRGPGPNVIWLDEAMISRRCWLIIRGRVLATEGMIIITTTPLGKRHWLYSDILLKAKEKPNLYYTRTAPTRDNKSLSKDEVSDIYSVYEGDFLTQELEGGFVAAEGLVYDCFDEEKHVIYNDPSTAEIKMVEKWNISGIDFGWTHPTVYLLGVLTKGLTGDKLYILDEIYESRLRNKILGQKIKEVESIYSAKYSLSSFTRVRDAANPKDAAELKIEGGITTIPAPRPWGGSIMKGIERTYSWIANDKVRVHSRCVNFLKELSLYAHATQRQTGVPTKETPKEAWNHACDVLRYIIETIERQMKMEQVKHSHPIKIPQKRQYSFRRRN